MAVRHAFTIAACALVVAFPGGAPAAHARGQSPLASATDADLSAGKRLFQSQCGLCHGIDGSGGTGPSLQHPTLQRVTDDESLVRAVRYGLSGTGMPSFEWQLTDRTARQIAAYVRSLGHVRSEPLPGDPVRGVRAYAQAGCAACHVVHGEGRALGPDLSSIGATRGIAHLRQSLVEPERAVPDGHVTVSVTRADGRTVRGVRVNEDVFWLHLRDEGGQLHTFEKREVKDVTREVGKSLMPAYGSVLSPGDIDDLVAYLATLRGRP